jgi:Zn-dependent M32 family carboxypeptidase
MACIYALQPAGDPTTLEGLNQDLGNMVSAGIHFANFILWSVISFVDYNNKRIQLLEKKAEKYDAMYDLVQELLEANKVDRQYADHLNRKIESFITDYKKKEKQK